MKINDLLKYAGFAGVGCGILFATLMVSKALFGFKDFPEELFGAFIGGGAMCFFGCLILVLNDIATQLKREKN